MLYLRQLLSLIVSLYTSRIVLNVLGVEDFGIYNVVGGIISMFSFINSAMASGTQRFLSYTIGIGDSIELKKIFSISLKVHFIIAIGIFILAETIGLWFLNYKMNIPIERLHAANWVFQFSILAAMVSLTQVPYNAVIIAHEKMAIYAYIGILEVFMRLVIVFLLSWITYDSLKLYAILVFVVTLFIALIYRYYCIYMYPECKYESINDKRLFKSLTTYAGWNLFGSGSSVISNHGINLLLNIYFGPAINAARAISMNVYYALTSFVSNFQQSVNPQIIKSYANQEVEQMNALIMQSSRFSFLLLFFLSAPILVETAYIIKIWLMTVPEYSITFIRLVLINALINCISGPLMTGAHATGRIKLYQSIIGTILLLNLPFSVIFLKIWDSPLVPFFSSIGLSMIGLFVRLLMLKSLISLNIGMFLRDVFFRIVLISSITLTIPLIIIHQFDQSFARFISLVFLVLILNLMSSIFFGLNIHERKFLKSKSVSIFSKFIKF